MVVAIKRETSHNVKPLYAFDFRVNILKFIRITDTKNGTPLEEIFILYGCGIFNKCV